MTFNNLKPRSIDSISVKTSRLLAAFVLTVSLFSGRSAHAQFFTNENSFDNASLSLDVVTFNGLVPLNGFALEGQPGNLTLGGVTFTTSNNTELFVEGPNAVGSGVSSYDVPGEYNFNGTATLDPQGNANGTVGASVLTVTIPASVSPVPVSAIGAEIGGFEQADPITITVELTGGPVTSESLLFTAQDANTSGLGYIGFDAPDGEAISSVSFSDSTPDAGDFPAFVLDDFLYGVADDVPEPGSVSLLALGALALFFFRRRLLAR